MDCSLWYLTQWWGHEAPKHFQMPNLHQKKVSVTIWCLNLGETIKYEKCAHKNDKDNRNLQYPQPALINRKGQFCFMTPLYNPECFHSWSIIFDQATKLCLINDSHLTSHQLTKNSSSITKFCKEIVPTSSRMQKCIPRVLNPEGQIIILSFAWWIPEVNCICRGWVTGEMGRSWNVAGPEPTYNSSWVVFPP